MAFREQWFDYVYRGHKYVGLYVCIYVCMYVCTVSILCFNLCPLYFNACLKRHPVIMRDCHKDVLIDRWIFLRHGQLYPPLNSSSRNTR